MVEGARLESVCRRNPTEGSNPSLSAKLRSASFGGAGGFRPPRGSRRDSARIPLSPPISADSETPTAQQFTVRYSLRAPGNVSRRCVAAAESMSQPAVQRLPAGDVWWAFDRCPCGGNLPTCRECARRDCPPRRGLLGFTRSTRELFDQHAFKQRRNWDDAFGDLWRPLEIAVVLRFVSRPLPRALRSVPRRFLSRHDPAGSDFPGSASPSSGRQ